MFGQVVSLLHKEASRMRYATCAKLQAEAGKLTGQFDMSICPFSIIIVVGVNTRALPNYGFLARLIVHISSYGTGLNNN